MKQRENMKYLLIDANNLAVRCAFANADLQSKAGVPTGVHFGFFQSLVNLIQKYQDYQMLIVWDGRSKRRMEESKRGVEQGIVPEAYKENRKKAPKPQPLINFEQQASFLQRGIGQTGIPQIRLHDYEADDIIATYSKMFRDKNEVVMVTSDKDYLQLLHENVIMWDGMKSSEYTEASFHQTYGIMPYQHVHCGALMGDDGDNIFGVPSWGEATALEAIKEHGTWQKVIDALVALAEPYRAQFPDLSEEDFKKLANLKTKTGKPKYPEITFNMPFTGVVLACDEKKIKPPLSKTTLMAIMFQERVKLAFSLKQMDTVPGLPSEICMGTFNEARLVEYFDYYSIESLKEDIDLFKSYASQKVVVT
ncbi:MAG: hypothetical protein WC375_03375 [Methanomassiliicoccales archaeon]|jgi:DNA polymerase-1